MLPLHLTNIDFKRFAIIKQTNSLDRVHPRINKMQINPMKVDEFILQYLVTRQNDSMKTIFVCVFHPTIRRKNALIAIGKHVPGPLTSTKSG